MSRVGLLFPGQGSQYTGMGQDLYNEIYSAKKLMNLSNEILGFDIKKIIFDGKDEELKLTEIAQPAIFIVSAMYFEKFKELNVEFEIVAGHSLGEYSALYAAEVLNFEEGLKLVRDRGIAMSKQNSKGTMFAVMGMDLEELKKYIDDSNGMVVIANINSKSQTVISGYNDKTIKLAEKLSLIDGVKVKQLNVSGAFHSPLMTEAKGIMDLKIDNTNFSNPSSLVIPNVTSIATRDVECIKNSLKEQIVGQINWLDTILLMKNIGIEELYEIGPGEVLKKLNKSIAFRPKCLSL